jgi:hypothetical protein
VLEQAEPDPQGLGLLPELQQPEPQHVGRVALPWIAEIGGSSSIPARFILSTAPLCRARPFCLVLLET